MNDAAEIRQTLVARAAALRASIAATEDDRKPVELDQVAVGRLSRMDALQQQAMAQATRRQAGRELQRIEAALKRLDAGDFGFCVTCGEEIGAARLSIDLTTATCIVCASGAGR
ncbi:MAG: TraR/DksA C4-type zinc finger protein [Parvularculaceae bacterium]|nr:TraR/DksA C4-type zinc finger protein [Parvularculaceae bacterium]